MADLRQGVFLRHGILSATLSVRQGQHANVDLRGDGGVDNRILRDHLWRTGVHAKSKASATQVPLHDPQSLSHGHQWYLAGAVHRAASADGLETWGILCHLPPRRGLDEAIGDAVLREVPFAYLESVEGRTD